MKPQIGAAAEEGKGGGGKSEEEEDEEGSRKSLDGAAAETPASNQTGCGETVKLLKQLQQNLRRRKTERQWRFFFPPIVLQNKMVFIKKT